MDKKGICECLFYLVVSLCLLCSVSSVEASTGFKDSRLDSGKYIGDANAKTSQISNDNNGHVYVIWEGYRNREPHIYFNYSEDYGRTWSTTAMRINNAKLPVGNGSGAFDPQISSDNAGHVYVTWIDKRNRTHGWQGVNIYCNYSEDYGVTWQVNDINLDVGGGGVGTSLAHRICCDENGNVYVVWYRVINGNINLHFAYSRDYGETWLSNVLKRDWSGESIELSHDEDGHVYLTWYDERNGKSDIYFNYSNNFGVSWQANDIRLDTGDEPGANDSYASRISSDGKGHVYVMWYDNRNGQDDIYLNYSEEYGETWQENDIWIKTGDPGKNVPWFAQLRSDEKGHVYVTWYDNRNDKSNNFVSDIFFNYSKDCGETWQDSDIRLDTGDLPGTNDSRAPNLSSDRNGYVYVTWHDYRNGQADIYLNYSEDYGETWQESDIRLDTGDLPGANHSHYPQLSSDNNGYVYVVWDDMRIKDSTIHFNYLVVDGLANLNDSVKVNPIESTYQWTSDTTGCPADFVGQFRFDVEIENTSDGPLTDLVIQVVELTGGNRLNIAEVESGNEETKLIIPKRDDYSDGELNSAETVILPFVICMKEWKPFKLLIDLLGKPDSSKETED